MPQDFERHARGQNRRRRGSTYEAKLTAVPELCSRGDLLRATTIHVSGIARPTLTFRGVCCVQFLAAFGSAASRVFAVVVVCVFGKHLVCVHTIRSPLCRAALGCCSLETQERKRALMTDADCIITLPGGLGTWDELWEMVCLKGIGKREKREALTKRASSRFFGLLDKAIPSMVRSAPERCLGLFSNLRGARVNAKAAHAQPV